ncbi:MAG: tRNA (guanosine(37)-N1)-methyltransferase TrmD [Clostridiales bacterium]|nr:tRNA (guanosine(37)-N1)-methyltransferase TrmD [Clostridiales bacterium]MCF8022610.1 tRNA (guanosine(37)-N1)-methyltransferase TrmD [Clostridiales bacterium]
MNIDILTLFPEMFQGPLDYSIIKRARDKGILNIDLINIRDFASDKHRTADDIPYGGGAGMVMRPGPVFEAVEHIRNNSVSVKVVLMCPTGTPFNQDLARELSAEEHIVLLCGHYEGLDERVRENIVDYEISVGDFVLTGGELPAMMVVDSVSRFIPGVLGGEKSALEDSFCDGLLEYPHYTRPAVFKGLEIPGVLASGHHEKIRKWRRKQSLIRTLVRRPDLLLTESLTAEDRTLLSEIKRELDKLV